MNNVILVRYGEPSKYDHGPYGALCKVIKGCDDKVDYYVQLSVDEELPQWNLLGTFDQESDNKVLSQVQEMLNK